MATCNYYPKFEDNQVLTAGQLNQLVDYLERQDRITRSKLVGAGIVCGLELELQKTSPVAVKISRGCGITSVGYLLSLNKYISEKTISDWHTFTKYRSYKDSSKYSLFGDADTQITMWELLYDNFEDPNSTIEKLSLKFLDDKAVILFLENKEIDLATCTGDDCNEKGKRVEMCTRVLLVSLIDLEKIVAACKQSSVSQNYKDELTGKFKLPELTIEREYKLSNKKNTFTGYQDIKTLYSEIIERTVKTIPEVLEKTFNLFYPLLNDNEESLKVKEFFNTESFKNFLKNNELGIQYYYDFIKDIVLTYNEFRDTVFELSESCGIEGACFPSHLMLGEAVPKDDGMPSLYRNQFVSAPIYNGQSDLHQKSKMLFKRIINMIKTFNIPSEKGIEIRITPSNEHVELGHRAIPYYYHEKEFLINAVWNYELNKKCKQFYNLSHFATSYPKSVAQYHIAYPLNYNIQDYGFFRIEGHLGMKYNSAMEILLKQIQEFNLPVKVIKLKLGKESESVDALPECSFQDLELSYNTLRNEYLCFLKNEINYFGHLDYGHKKEESKTGGIQITVVSKSDGKPLQGASVSLKSSSNKTLTIGGTTNTKGIYTATQIPVGSYTISVSLPDYITASQEVNIQELKSVTVTINLEKKSITIIDKGTSPKKYEIGSELLFSNEYVTKEKILQSSEEYKYAGNSVGNFIISFAASENKDMFQYFNSIIETATEIKPSTEEFISKIYYPVRIVELLEIIFNTVPQSMLNFNYKVLLEKNDSLMRIAGSFSDQINKNLENDKYEQTGKESEILVHLNDIIKECTLQNFNSLVEIHKQRAAEIAKMTLFNEFVKKHPGVEHHAGAKKGGTFIIVCDEKNIVVADFTLPYICCSDCPPVTFVLGDQSVIFKLPKTTFCANDTSKYIVINEPSGGVVTGAGITQDSATGQFYFTPSNAGEGQIKLSYVYNLKTYNTLINVIKIKPNFSIVLGKPNTDKGTREVEFSAMPDGADVYEWDFGDGVGKSSEQKPTYTYSVSEKQSFEVKLTVTKGDCKGVYSQVISVPICSAEFTHKIEKVINNTAIVQFDALMKNAEKYEWDFGDGKKYSGEDPLHEFNVSETKTFKVILYVKNGDCEDTNEATITINVCPAEFSYQILKVNTNSVDVIFTANTKDADKYAWTFGDGTTSGSLNSSEIKHSYLLKNEEQNINVNLVMEKGYCTSTYSSEVKLSVSQEVTISLEKNEFCKKDESSYKFNLSAAGGTLTGKGVSQKGSDYYFTPSDKNVVAGTNKFIYKLSGDNSSEYSVMIYNPIADFTVVGINSLPDHLTLDTTNLGSAALITDALGSGTITAAAPGSTIKVSPIDSGDLEKPPLTATPLNVEIGKVTPSDSTTLGKTPLTVATPDSAPIKVSPSGSVNLDATSPATTPSSSANEKVPLLDSKTLGTTPIKDSPSDSATLKVTSSDSATIKVSPPSTPLTAAPSEPITLGTAPPAVVTTPGGLTTGTAPVTIKTPSGGLTIETKPPTITTPSGGIIDGTKPPTITTPPDGLTIETKPPAITTPSGGIIDGTKPPAITTPSGGIIDGTKPPTITTPSGGIIDGTKPPTITTPPDGLTVETKPPTITTPSGGLTIETKPPTITTPPDGLTIETKPPIIIATPGGISVGTIPPNTQVVSVKKYIVQIENRSLNANQFIWQVNGVVVSKEAKPKRIIIQMDPKTKLYELSLTASYNKCSDTFKTTLNLDSSFPYRDDVNIVTVGGATTIFKPSDTGIILNDQPIFAMDTNIDSIKNLYNSSQFGKSLTLDTPAYKNSVQYFDTVNTELQNPTVKNLYASGMKNDEIAGNFNLLLGQTSKSITGYEGTNKEEQQQFAYNLLMLQTSQLFNTLSLQQSDIESGSSVGSLLSSLGKTLTNIKSAGINLDPDGKFSEVISSAVSASSEKPVMLTYLNRLTKVVSG